MNRHSYITQIPLEVGDIVQADEYINKYEIVDIIAVHYTNPPKTDVILQLKDIETNITIRLNYLDYKWKIIKYNE